MAKRRKQRGPGTSGTGQGGSGRQGGAQDRSPGAGRSATPPVAATRSQRTSRPPRARPRSQPRGLLGGADPWRVGIVGALLVGIVVVVLAVVAGGGGSGHYTCGQELQPGGSPEDGQVTADLGRGHVTTGTELSYLFCPPTSGTHYSEAGVAPARPGFYKADADIGPGSWVHNLEHGYVVVLYRCPDGICPSDGVACRDRAVREQRPADAPPPRTAVSGRRSSPRASTRWRRRSPSSPGIARCSLDSFDIDVANTFAQRWMEKNAPEPNNC